MGMGSTIAVQSTVVSDASLWDQVREAVNGPDNGPPRYERIAVVIERGILAEQLAPDERLPTVRDLADRLGVSGTTIVGAYSLLRDKGLIRGEVGRGTFVGVDGARPAPGPRFSPTAPQSFDAARAEASVAWRRRALVSTEMRLRAGHPHAIDLTRGTPDPALLPIAQIREGLARAAQELRPEDLQYPAQAEALPELVETLLPLLAADDVPATHEQLLVGSSAQQFLTLVVRVLRARVRASDIPLAVEDPGYQTAMDTFERAGCRLLPVAVDAHGVRPEALDAALQQGAQGVLLTPRAHSPTGASWTPERRAEIAAVLAARPRVLVVEDDPLAGITAAPCGSLRSDERLAEHVVHIRSFSKYLGPDLRVAVAVCDDELRAALSEEKSFDDGWTSRLAQKTLAHTLASSAGVLAHARDAYAARRAAAAEAIHQRIAPEGGAASAGADGLHVWVRLPSGYDAQDVLSRTAARGFLAAPGEPFFVRPGHQGAIRLNAGAATSLGIAEAAGHALAESIDELRQTRSVASFSAITV